jgi:pyruvate dehydrogenase E2 component (dihydrolipoamide acetyltransferase)
MRVEVVVPQIGEAVSELTLTQWIKHAGDAVKTGDVLFEIDSDKAIVEVEAFVDGTLTEVLFGDGASVMPLQVVAAIETEVAAAAITRAALPAQSEVVPAGNGAKASPVAERMAADLGIDLARVSGTGPGGRITLDDVRQYDAQRSSPVRAVSVVRPLASPKARLLARQQQIDLVLVTGTGSGGMVITCDLERGTPSASVPVPALSVIDEAPSRTRQVIAQRMTASKQQVPHFYLMTDVHMTQAQALRTYCVDVLRWDKAPTYTDLMVRACALALGEQPEVNRSFHEGGIVAHEAINIGVAVSTDDGLVVPTLVNADRASLRQVSTNVREVAARARQKRLRPADLTSKSLTISNLGMYRVDAFIAIIDMPDPMILAVGRIADRVVAVDRQVAIQPMCTLTLSVDHRVLDGAVAAQFIERVAAHLEAPFALLGDG